jgi:hypothetical protein
MQHACYMRYFSTKEYSGTSTLHCRSHQYSETSTLYTVGVTKTVEPQYCALQESPKQWNLNTVHCRSHQYSGTSTLCTNTHYALQESLCPAGVTNKVNTRPCRSHPIHTMPCRSHAVVTNTVEPQHYNACRSHQYSRTSTLCSAGVTNTVEPRALQESLIKWNLNTIPCRSH